MANPCDLNKEVVMVTTIGIDPHKATHTAVAIDGSETVLAEICVPADRYQTKKLIDWVHSWMVMVVSGRWRPPAGSGCPRTSKVEA